MSWLHDYVTFVFTSKKEKKQNYSLNQSWLRAVYPCFLRIIFMINMPLPQKPQKLWHSKISSYLHASVLSHKILSSHSHPPNPPIPTPSPLYCHSSVSFRLLSKVEIVQATINLELHTLEGSHRLYSHRGLFLPAFSQTGVVNLSLFCIAKDFHKIHEHLLLYYLLCSVLEDPDRHCSCIKTISFWNWAKNGTIATTQVSDVLFSCQHVSTEENPEVTSEVEHICPILPTSAPSWFFEVCRGLPLWNHQPQLWFTIISILLISYLIYHSYIYI